MRAICLCIICPKVVGIIYTHRDRGLTPTDYFTDGCARVASVASVRHRSMKLYPEGKTLAVSDSCVDSRPFKPGCHARYSCRLRSNEECNSLTMRHGVREPDRPNISYRKSHEKKKAQRPKELPISFEVHLKYMMLCSSFSEYGTITLVISC